MESFSLEDLQGHQIQPSATLSKTGKWLSVSSYVISLAYIILLFHSLRFVFFFRNNSSDFQTVLTTSVSFPSHQFLSCLCEVLFASFALFFFFNVDHHFLSLLVAAAAVTVTHKNYSCLHFFKVFTWPKGEQDYSGSGTLLLTKCSLLSLVARRRLP